MCLQTEKLIISVNENENKIEIVKDEGKRKKKAKSFFPKMLIIWGINFFL